MGWSLSKFFLKKGILASYQKSKNVLSILKSKDVDVKIKTNLKKASESVSQFSKKRPLEVGSTLTGLAAGTLTGYAVGGSIGVVALGTGIGIPWVVLTAIFGIVAGNRLGVHYDKKALQKRSDKQEVYLEALLRERQKNKIISLQTSTEHRKQLIDALKNTKKKLCILSGWATSYVVDTEFKEYLRILLQRGVDVYIGYGYQAKGEKKPPRHYEEQTRKDLQDLLEWCAEEDTDGILIVDYFPNHQKLLLSDQRYAVNGSFNWLSNQGTSKNEERSWVVFDKKFIETEWEIVETKFIERNNSTRRGFLKKFVPFSRH
tara:strand:- start:258 stop:1208 length:951 start_codon:yes stop_codon:yes gene_type:complete